MNLFPLRDGVVHCEDVSLALIAREVGTPVFIYSTGAIRHQERTLGSALSNLDDPLDPNNTNVLASTHVPTLGTGAGSDFAV